MPKLVIVTVPHIETFSSYDTLKRFRGGRVSVHVLRKGGSHATRHGVILSIGLRNIAIESERSGNVYRIPLTSITKVEVIP
jgi:ribosome maturation factor RimP